MLSSAAMDDGTRKATTPYTCGASDAAPIDVLVVDDDEAQRDALVRTIRAFGYPVRCAVDGERALAEYVREPAAIVLSDWSMHEMSGLDLCVALKSLPSPPHVVLMSGHEERERLLHALRAGADEFIAKPIDLEELEVRLLASTRMVKATRALDEQRRSAERESARRFEVARTDPLTAIPNRLRMDEDLARARDEALRYGRRSCLAICDVDHFKQYNDRHGHLQGDTALQQVAVLLRDSVRASDTVYRFGGEEFVLLFPEQTVEDVAAVLDRIRLALHALAIEHAVPGSPDGVLTISAGVAEFAGSDVKDWLARADAALYRSKVEGRDRVSIG